METTQTLDCRGMQCPAPILHIAKAARAAGAHPAVLQVLVDDGDFPSDVKAWCRTSRAQLLDMRETHGIITARIGLNGAQAPSAPPPLPTSRRPKPKPREEPAARSTRPDAIRIERVDCRGMQCPAPILAVSKAARRHKGKPVLIEVLADDVDFPSDLAAWCRTAQAAIHETSQNGSVHRAVIGVNGASAAAPRPTASRPSRAAPSVSAPPAPAPVSPTPPSVGPLPASASESVALGQPSAVRLDLRGQRAPAPILALSAALVEHPGANATVYADDPAFMTDLMAWSAATKVSVLSARQEPEAVTVVELRLGSASSAPPRPAAPLPPVTAIAPQAAVPAEREAALPRENRCTLLVMRNDFESLMAAMMCATTAAAQGMEVGIFFSFWGVNLLRGDRPRRDVPKKRVSLLQRLMQWMMPKGPRRQKMSKMHMGGVGKGMMQHFMRRNHVMTLDELVEVAVEQNVRFVVCSMSMGIMGIQERDIVDLPNIEFAGVSSFIEQSASSRMSLVF